MVQSELPNNVIKSYRKESLKHNKTSDHGKFLKNYEKLVHVQNNTIASRKCIRIFDYGSGSDYLRLIQSIYHVADIFGKLRG